MDATNRQLPLDRSVAVLLIVCSLGLWVNDVVRNPDSYPNLTRTVTRIMSPR